MKTLTTSESKALATCLPGQTHSLTRLNDLVTAKYVLGRVYCRQCGAYMTDSRKKQQGGSYDPPLLRRRL